MSNNITASGIAAMLAEHESIVILCHTNPDEDTVGSAYALCLALEKLGKSVAIACDKRPPRKSAAIIDEGRFATDAALACGTLVLSVDVAAAFMLGGLEGKFSQAVDIRIDHHAVSDEFAHFNYNRPDAPACAMLVYEVINELGVDIDNQIAAALYMAISSDTGGFRYSNTTPAAHRLAAELIEKGAPASKISEALYETKTRENLRAYRLGIEKLEYLFEGRAALIFITNLDKRSEKLKDEDLEALATLSRQSEGTELGLFLRQIDDNEKKYKLSLRSKDSFDCAAFCARLGGGGHVRAAGASLFADSAEEARGLVLSLLDEYKSSLL